MTSEGSVTHWIGQLKVGDHTAAQKLWEGYFQKMVALARHLLQGAPRRAADEEDVALSAFDSFCRGAEQGHFPQLLDRDNLWRLLVVITARKAFLLAKHERRQKRSSPAAETDRHQAAAEDSAEAELEIERIIGPEPTPEFAAQVAEECRRLLDGLGDETLRQVALWKMEGYTNTEIATKLGCVIRTVERKLRVIRGLWAKEVTL